MTQGQGQSKYPWDEWVRQCLTGEVEWHEVEPMRDYSVAVRDFRRAVYHHARRKGIKAETVLEDRVIRFRFVWEGD